MRWLRLSPKDRWSLVDLFRVCQIKLTIGLVAVFVVVGAVLLLSLKGSNERGLELAQRIFTDNITQDVLTGADFEVSRKCRAFAADPSVRTLSIVDGSGREICAIRSADIVHSKIHRSFVYFDEEKDVPAASISVGYANNIFAQSTFALVAIVTLCAITLLAGNTAVLRVLDQNVMRPLQSLGETLCSGDLYRIRSANASMEPTSVNEVRILFAETTKMADGLLALHLQMIEKAKSDAIVRATQMLAHDVRKPFSKMLSGLDMIKDAHDGERIRAITMRLIPEVESGIKAINSMLTDIMNVGSEGTTLPASELVDPTTLLQRTLEDIFRTHVDANIEIESDLRHNHLVSVDAHKMQRVFQNIIENAMQAINMKGRIWIKTTSSDSSTRLSIKLGNTGSFIASADIPRLFDAFFTKDKKGGTGLGLAIVKNIVEQHGGSITCFSERDFGVEFTIELPRALEKLAGDRLTSLPPTSASYRLAVEDVIGEPQFHPMEGSSGKAPLPDRLVASLRMRESRLKVLAVDDEPIYTEYLRGLIGSESELATYVEFAAVSSATEALKLAHEWHPDVAILDVDLGDPSCNGYLLSQNLRAKLARLRICVHSNRISSRDGAAAVAAGAEAFLPKPMTRTHLIRFLESIIVNPGVDPGFLAREAPSTRPLIALVEDDIFMTEAWAEALRPDADCMTFLDPATFRQHFEEDSSFRERLTAIVLDNHFEGTDETGADLARSLQGRTAARILFGSDATLFNDDRQYFHAICGKRPMPWPRLSSLVEA